MDNEEQIEEIISYYHRLVNYGIKLTLEDAARIWIGKYAKLWREMMNKGESDES